MPREPFQSAKEKTSESGAIRSNIGRQLRTTYAPDVAKPLPKRLVELLRRLAERDDKAPC
jgi:anti-sigma factor NepR-like protein